MNFNILLIYGSLFYGYYYDTFIKALNEQFGVVL